MKHILDTMRQFPVMPVLTIDDPEYVVPLARALYAGGIRILEITLRTRHGLSAIRALTEQVPELVVGAGTLMQPEDFFQARDAGATFGVSPGLTAALVSGAQHSGLPWLPGVMTPSEVMVAREAGLTALKLFPATAAGGVAMCRAMAGPFPDVLFCPTGGITQETYAQFLACSNVVCVGGSWLTPLDKVNRQDWVGVTEGVRDVSG